ncbi:MAG: UDP-N-acetylmuramoylalanine--D-glutamate ligase [Candidatus Saccharibacteria bacterium]|nr:UDP-N-acetylmuramoylalanine--D-glutamate ligase [Candidatus Saccharibacteria bacterium]
MKIAILGYDTEGRSSYDYFAAQGHELTICDQNADLVVPEGASAVLGERYLDDLDRFDVLVRTAGLPPRLILEKNPTVASKVTTQINEFLRVAPTKNVIGVTGTKGKGTTSTLVTRMLEAAGKTVFLGGNIGVPPLSFLGELGEDSWVVLELSSFQLIDLQHSPHIAVCVMVVPEHLNWHTDLNEYLTAKAQLFAHQTASDVAIYFAENQTSQQIASTGQAHKIPYYAPPGATIDNGCISISGQVICRTDELQLLGTHNWQNACAAVTAVWQVTQDVAALRSVLTTFSGLPHRLELVRELTGVKYYDDSFGTTPETAIVALQAFNQPKVIILGGSDKGASYDDLAQAVASGNVRKALLIGDESGKIHTALHKAGFSAFEAGGDTMEEIVGKARDAAAPGDIVLLSTGCASFGMFQNYKDRAAQFIQAVQALA